MGREGRGFRRRRRKGDGVRGRRKLPSSPWLKEPQKIFVLCLPQNGGRCKSSENLASDWNFPSQVRRFTTENALVLPAGGRSRWGRDHIGGVGVTSGHEVLNFPQCLGDSLSVCSSFSALERAAMQLTQSSHSLVSERLPSHGPQHDCSGQASLSIANSQSLLKPMSIESVMPSSHLTLCRPLLLLPSVFPSIRVFSNESALHIRWPKYWSFSLSIQ